MPRLQVYREIEGPTGYVQSRSADMVPSVVGTGEVGTYFIPEGAESRLETASFVDQVLFEINVISLEEANAAREIIEGLIAKGTEVTENAVLNTIQKRSSN